MGDVESVAAAYAREDGADAATSGTLRYRAFLSYAHGDRAAAGRLHRALETFRVPDALVGRETGNGSVPPHLRPIFRDRDELPASADLGETIRAALAQSEALIVLCSPAAARSRWTDEEVRLFRHLHPGRPVLAAILAGEPFASDRPGGEEKECFPRALRHQIDARGRVTKRRSEPVAADLRPHGDGWRLGVMKVIAGLIGVPLDELVQRESARRHRRAYWLAAASLIGMLFTSGLAVVALDARDSAREERAAAEDLVGFMLGDLKDKLQPLGRLDVLDAVGARALEHYSRQDKSALTDESLVQRARALTLIGEIANLRGDLDGALRRYEEALEGTAEALRRAPDDPERIYDHAQNVFWVGYIDWQRGRLSEAEARFLEYKRLAVQMMAIDPDEPRWRLESVYADTNLGTLLLKTGDYRRAAQVHTAALREAERLAAAQPRERRYQEMVSESLAYLSDAQEGQGLIEEAIGSRERQMGTIRRIAALDGEVFAQRHAMAAHRALGRLFASRGEISASRSHLLRAARIAEQLRAREPDNTEWLQFAAYAHLDLGLLLLAIREPESAVASIRSGCGIARGLEERDRSVVQWTEIGRRCLIARARAAGARGNGAEALALAERAAAIPDDGDPERRFARAQALLLQGDQLGATGQLGGARRAWTQAIALLPQRHRAAPFHAAARFALHSRLGQAGEASQIRGALEAIGYRHPDFIESTQAAESRLPS